jgi:hypothetical protein
MYGLLCFLKQLVELDVTQGGSSRYIYICIYILAEVWWWMSIVLVIRSKWHGCIQGFFLCSVNLPKHSYIVPPRSFPKSLFCVILFPVHTVDKLVRAAQVLSSASIVKYHCCQMTPEIIEATTLYYSTVGLHSYENRPYLDTSLPPAVLSLLGYYHASRGSLPPRRLARLLYARLLYV